MGEPATDRAQLLEALTSVVGRVAGFVAALPDTSLPVPGGQWTVGEMANHLTMAQGGMAQLARGRQMVHGDGTLAGLPAANAAALERDPERGGAALAAALVGNTEALVAALEVAPPGMPVQTPVGVMEVGVLGSYALSHLLQHGCHLARAVRRPLPIEAGHVELMLPFMFHVLPLMANPDRTEGVDACFEIRIRGGSRFCVTFAGGSVTVTPAADRRVDCRILADPVVLVLLAFGLANQWSGIARGKLLTWGPKPWLALRFVGYFDVP